MTPAARSQTRAEDAADRICTGLDLVCYGWSGDVRGIVAERVIEHVSYWHSDHTGQRNHRWSCNRGYPDPENIVFGKHPDFDDCRACMPG